MTIIESEEFKLWEATIRASVRGDPMWKFNAYRVSLYLTDQSALDVRALHTRREFPLQADQLSRAVSSISANIAEGLGRATPADRSQYFSIALGSLREALSWYRAVEPSLGVTVVDLRSDQLSELRRILLGALKWLSTKPKKARLY